MTLTEALLLFGISPFYSPEELQDRWRYLIKQHHPDLGHNPEYFKRLITAHEVLKNTGKHILPNRNGTISQTPVCPRKPRQKVIAQNSLGNTYSLSSSGLTVVGALSSPYSLRVCQQLFDIQLRLSAASGQYYIFFSNHQQVCSERKCLLSES